MRQYPFGRPVRVHAPVPPRELGGVFVVGSTPSALHVRWRAPDGATTIAALPVDDEPAPFWDGRDATARIEEWKAAVGFRDEWGDVEPVPRANGPWGRHLDAEVLAPLGTSREHAWLTCCVDEYRVSPGLDRMIRERLLPFAADEWVPRPRLGKPATESSIGTEARRGHLDRLRREMRAARPSVLVTLGDAAHRVLAELVPTDPWEDEWFIDDYGRPRRTSFEGRQVTWYQLAHPRSVGTARHDHRRWVAGRTAYVVAATRPCPRCGARRLVPILHGMPQPDISPEARAGRVVIGGCVVTGDDPEHRCAGCGALTWSDGRWVGPRGPW